MQSGSVNCIKMLFESIGETFRVSPTFFQSGDGMAERGKLSIKVGGDPGHCELAPIQWAAI